LFTSARLSSVSAWRSASRRERSERSFTSFSLTAMTLLAMASESCGVKARTTTVITPDSESMLTSTWRFQ
jgi:hypothetical protein